MDSFWDFFWFIISFFLPMAYLMVLFQIVTDLFRDHTTSGGMKAVWIFFLIFLPVLTSLVYLVARGPGMTERNVAAVKLAQSAPRRTTSDRSRGWSAHQRTRSPRPRACSTPEPFLGRGVREAEGQGADLRHADRRLAVTVLMPDTVESLFWLTACGVVAPLAVGTVLRRKVPEVVVLLVLGVLIGLHVRGLAATDGASASSASWASGCCSCSRATRSRPRSWSVAAAAGPWTTWVAALALALGVASG